MAGLDQRPRVQEHRVAALERTSPHGVVVALDWRLRVQEDRVAVVELQRPLVVGLAVLDQRLRVQED